MDHTINATMDHVGRLVIPRSIRRAAGLEAGMPLEFAVHDGCVEIIPAAREVVLRRRGRLMVAVPADAPHGERLTRETVRATQDRLRKERHRS